MQLTVKQLRRALEDVPDDDTKVIIFGIDKEDNPTICCFANDGFYNKEEKAFYIQGSEQQRRA